MTSPLEQGMAFHQQQQATKTILVVEDEPDIGAVLTEALLQETSYHVVLVDTPSHALQDVKNITPHLLILNYNLPQMNGLDLCDRLHHANGLEQVPTILLSARLPHQQLAQRHILGMSKPFDLDELLETVDKLLA